MISGTLKGRILLILLVVRGILLLPTKKIKENKFERVIIFQVLDEIPLQAGPLQRT